jgi:hippurate hydrolase
VLDLMENNMRRIVTKLCEAYGAVGELNFVRCYPPLSNWPKETAFAADLAEKLFGANRVDRATPPHTGAEDFSFYLEKVPGSYFFIGNGGGDHRLDPYQGIGPCELHNSNYDFNDALLPIGATFWCKLVEATLGGNAGA